MKADKRFDVIGIGGCAWDFMALIPRWPQLGEKVPMTRFLGARGGQAGTATVAVARVGGRAAVIGTTADDLFGSQISEDFVHEGVDISHLLVDPGKASHFAFCAVLEGSGERVIFHSGGSKRRLTPEDLDLDFLTSASVLLVDTHHSIASAVAARLVREAGLPVVVDLERMDPEVEKLFALATHNVIGLNFLREYTGESDRDAAVAQIRERYNPAVMVVTLGDRGCIGYQGNEVFEQPAYKIDSVVDTTGAGDVFHGIFAYGLALGYDLPTNLAFASLVAGIKCRALGGATGVPTREELTGLWPHPLP